jgi:hypothetical protein
MMVFFQNERCVKCGEALGFLPDTLEMATAASKAETHRFCANKDQHQICNWLVPCEDENTFCPSCRLNEVIPDLTVQGNRERWQKLELAKRRCLYTYLQLRLPLEAGEKEGQNALRFRFLGDTDSTPVLTGHENGVITINIAEADEDERERRRLKMHEPYRTLIGHLRHETGHYYWDRLIAGSPHLPEFRELFGDETADYDAALQKYYKEGPAADWPERTVSAYASLHPWEDWAETWAHYLHLVETLDTAASFGLSLKTTGSQNEASKSMPSPRTPRGHTDFDKLLAGWLPLTCVLNSLNRGMGIPDLYPFVITDAVTEKMRFIHNVIEKEAGKAVAIDPKLSSQSQS